MDAYGIHGNILNCFEGYLSNREQFALITNTYSDLRLYFLMDSTRDLS